jgi:hypothetical protein
MGAAKELSVGEKFCVPEPNCIDQLHLTQLDETLSRLEKPKIFVMMAGALLVEGP